MVIYRGAKGRFGPKPTDTAAPAPAATPATPVEQVTTAFKGFHIREGKLDCRDHKFEVGRRDTLKPEFYYGTKGLKLCYYGFHACESLWKVLEFYPLSHDRAYAEVQLHGPTVKDNNKLAALSITPVKQMHWAHVINRLALELREARQADKTAMSDVAYNEQFNPQKHLHFQIVSNQAGMDTLYIPPEYICAQQLCTRAQARMYNFSTYSASYQIAAADYVTQFATGGYQIMAGNQGVTSYQGNYGKIEVLGKNCTVNIIGSAIVKATEGTIINILGGSEAAVLRRVITPDLADQWLTLRDVTPRTPPVFDLAKR